MPVLSSVSVPTLHVGFLSRLSALEWIKIDTDIPQSRGVYGLVHPLSGATLYFGAARGQNGLARRVGNEHRWVREHVAALARDLKSGKPLLDSTTSDEVPVVRIAAELGLDTWAAETRPAAWAYRDVQSPAEPLEWESFLREASRILTGHRGVIGGGGWESKANSLGDRMAATAYRRLSALRASGDAVEVGPLREIWDSPTG